MQLNLKKIFQICSHYPKFRQKQILQAIFLNLINDWHQVTTLPKDLLAQLEENVNLKIGAKLLISEDTKSAKARIAFDDNCAVETALMRHKDKRNTVCVSSQVGCALGCDFCATAKMGFVRNLTVDEILIQVLYWQRFLKQKKDKVSNVVFMGMGEPFLNYENVVEAIKLLNDKNFFNIASRHISVSTVGIVEGLEKFIKENWQVNLAVSLHAPNDEIRKKIMPTAKQYSLEKILMTVKKYIEISNRKVMIEYLLLAGVNDSQKDAQQLAWLLKKHLQKLFVVNLIVYNKTQNYQAPSVSKINDFKNELQKNHIQVVRRHRFGQDIKSACGQLMIEK